MFCPKCGRNIDENICPYCHTEINNDNLLENYNENLYNEINKVIVNDEVLDDCVIHKSRVMAGILQIFLGSFGIGRFYLGYYKIAVWQIIVSICTLFIGGTVWGFFDGIRILNGKPYTDAWGKTLEN